MADRSKIEWTDASWNPVDGCTKASDGCKNCYAERIAQRFWDRSFSEVRFHPDRLKVPEHWRRPRRIFVCSMGDLFHPDVSDEEISMVWNVMQVLAPQHIYIVLTKRPERMRDIMQIWECEGTSGVADNIWLGVTAENQEMADERIPILLDTPAAVGFVSIEPMLGEVDIYQSLKGSRNVATGIDWVICGCESGTGARHMNKDWAFYLKEQCVNAHVPFFFKQKMRNGKLFKMPYLDDRKWDQYPKPK